MKNSEFKTWEGLFGESVALLSAHPKNMDGSTPAFPTINKSPI